VHCPRTAGAASITALSSSPPTALTRASLALLPPVEVCQQQLFPLGTSPQPICSYARVFAWMQTNHVSGLHPRCCRRPKQGSKPNGAKATSQPCLALLTGGSSLPAAKSGLFQTLNDPSPPLSSHLIRASPGSLDAAGVGAGCAGWMSLPG
jgi:hypothetical protein